MDKKIQNSIIKNFGTFFAKFSFNNTKFEMHKDIYKENWGFILIFFTLMLVMVWISDLVI